MKNYLTTFRNWKHRNVFLAFLSGFLIATLIWLSIKGKDVKLATEMLNTERKRTERLQKDLTDAKEIIKGAVKFTQEVEKIQETNLKLTEENERLKDKKVPTVGNFYDDELADSITKWAYKIRGYTIQ